MTKEIKVGKVKIGNNNSISIQSMTNTDTLDFAATLGQINQLAQAGCDIVRLAVSSMDEVNACKNIIGKTDVPLVADIQFDYKLAIACSDIGFDKIRFNPGNIGSDRNVESLTAACKSNNTPIRIGVNAGSLNREMLNKYGRSAEALAESALFHSQLLERFGFYNTILSVKASDVKMMIEANRLLSQRCDYPLHIGVTESGAKLSGIVKSAIGIGSLLADGIGDTIRVSLSGNPVEEIEAARAILSAVGKFDCVEIISCPTCSRCKYDMISIIDEVDAYTKNIRKKMKIAIMGCIVNGPGEAKDADFGVAGGESGAVIFENGELKKTITHDEIIANLKEMVDKRVNNG